MSTTENNKLLAEFMGFTLGHPDKNETRWKNCWFTTSNGTWNSRIDILHFNTDWNWLMEVIEKIRGIVNTELSVDDFDKHRGLEQRLNPYNYDIQSIYNGCIEFIKWYNLQNQ